MKLAVIYRPKNTPPLDAVAGMFEGMGQWLQKYQGQMDVLYFFAGGGGFGVVDIDDAAELQRMLAEHPFTTFADVEINPVVEAQAALQNLQESLTQRD
jgi:muconolactone delta-isomerase